MAELPQCAEITIGDQGLQVRLPGGPTLQVMIPDVNPSDLRIAKDLLGQANAALAPLAPIFSIVDAILAVQSCIEAIPDSLGPPPDPSAMSDCLEELAKKMAALAQLVPQLSIPQTIVDLLDLIITSLRGFIAELEAVVAQELRIAQAELTAAETGNGALLSIVVCAKDVNAQVYAGIGEGLSPLNSLFNVLGIFMGLIGQSPPDPIGDLPADPSDAVDQLNAVVETLETLRDGIPVP